MNRTCAFVCVLAIALVGCSDDDDNGGTLPTARLRPLWSCGEAADYIKEAAVARMRKQVDDQLARYARGEACYHGGTDDASTGNGSGGGSPSPTPPEGGPSQGTGTNNQVSGVDEADFIKNDGQYIYLALNDKLRIVDSWPAAESHTVSTTPLPGEPRKLFVDGNRALVYVATGTGNNNYRECTYGYDCAFTGDGTATTLLVYDITDRASPQLIRTVGLSGSLISGRKIGSTVHTVVTQAANPFPDVETFIYDNTLCDYQTQLPPARLVRRASLLYAQLAAANEQKIRETNVDQRLPAVTDDSGLTPQGEDASCGSLYGSSITDGTGFTSIVSLKLDDPGPVQMWSIMSRPGAIYASTDALYMAVPHQWGEDDVSTVHKFRIGNEPAATYYIGSGFVAGRALNQFAMDEKDGLLRIATTESRAPSPDAVSYLTVLREQGDDLVKVGGLGGIAPTEDIRSVRFDGDRAFVVTFKKTDPLFAFDLSNPAKPKKLGELKIPGFSTYMHMMDDGHLLTIGYDADDHGDFAFFDGVLLQIFDVTNPTVPSLMHRFTIGTRGSSSEALTNHLAFTWYPEESLLALPMTVCEGGNDGVYGQTMTFNGLMVFDTSIAGGFGEHGRVPHAVAPNISCGNWWTNGTSTVRRSLFLDNFVYSVSEQELKVRDIAALGAELRTVPLLP